jgi:hypothetical protein
MFVLVLLFFVFVFFVLDTEVVMVRRGLNFDVHLMFVGRGKSICVWVRGRKVRKRERRFHPSVSV